MSSPSVDPMALLKSDLIACFELLKLMARHPTQVIRKLPDWHIRRFTLIQVILGVAVGVGRGLAKLSLFAVLTEPLLSTIAAIIVVAALSFAGFHLARFLTKQPIDFTKFYGVVALAYIPFGLTRVFEVSVWPFELVGVAGSFLLAIMGFSENLNIGRKGLTRIFGGLYVCILGYWIVQTVMETRNQYILEKTASPIDIEEIEKDLSQSD